MLMLMLAAHEPATLKVQAGVSCVPEPVQKPFMPRQTCSFDSLSGPADTAAEYSTQSALLATKVAYSQLLLAESA